MQTEAKAFLTAFSAVVTAPPPASSDTTLPQRQARKLRPVKLQSQEAGNPPAPTPAFANARVEAGINAPFPRQRPKAQNAGPRSDTNDPFLRKLPQKLDTRKQVKSYSPNPKRAQQKPKRRPRRFVPLSHLEDTARKSDVHDSSPLKLDLFRVPLPATKACQTALSAETEFRERVAQHVAHLRSVSSSPSDFFTAIKALLSCLHASTNGEPVSLWPDCQPLQAAVYCQEVLHEIIPLFADYPAPVSNALREALPDAGLPTPEVAFPSSAGVWNPCLGCSLSSLRALDAEPEDVSRRLLGNLETTWDQIVRLQRMYRGDIASCPPGTLDVNVALRAMAMLHPANMDVFAARLLKLVSETGLHGRDTPLKMRQLGERLRDAPPRKQGEKGPGVVLHRLPGTVRSMFEDDLAQLFFLDFLTGVDSAKLNTALVPRLVAAVAKALEAAAVATTNTAFTDAVLDARVYAKLLSVTMHASNWAHSAFSLSGMHDNHVSPGLGPQALQRRVPIHSAFFSAVIDVEALIHDAVSSEHVLPVVACVAVADVIIRLAAVDPVAKVSDWYKRGLDALRSVRALSSTDLGSMPLLHVIVCALLKDEACKGDGPLDMPDKKFVLRCDKKEWSAIGDTRLLRVVCPSLDDLRKSIYMPDAGAKATARRITPQVAPNAPSTLLKQGGVGKEHVVEGKEDTEEDGDVKAALRREFYTRMDGRLRELVRVVASSRPESGAVAKDTYMKIVDMLYPKTCKTVAAVAANLCEYEVGVIEKELQQNSGEKEKTGKKDCRAEEQREIEKANEGIGEMQVDER